MPRLKFEMSDDAFWKIEPYKQTTDGRGVSDTVQFKINPDIVHEIDELVRDAGHMVGWRNRQDFVRDAAAKYLDLVREMVFHSEGYNRRAAVMLAMERRRIDAENTMAMEATIEADIKMLGFYIEDDALDSIRTWFATMVGYIEKFRGDSYFQKRWIRRLIQNNAVIRALRMLESSQYAEDPSVLQMEKWYADAQRTRTAV